jgi:hypothetical protein
MKPMKLPGNAGHHAVQFYRDASGLCLSVADFLADGIAAAQPLVLIATPEHRTLICSELARRRFPVESLIEDKQFLLLDARRTLNRFFFRGKLDPFAFRETIGQAIAMVCGDRIDCTIRAYGEMVDVLWREGKCEEAIELEILWNDLAKRHAFSLLCGYAMGNFYKETDRRADVCALHTHVHDEPATPGRPRS